MFVRMIAEVSATKTTDNSFFNDRDELYFSIAGSRSQGNIVATRVPEDYFGLKSGQTVRDIGLWEGNIADGEYVYMIVVLREQDNAQLPAIASAVKGAAFGIGAIFVDPALGAEALDALKNAAGQFVDSLSGDGDQTIGAFATRIRVHGGSLSVEWFEITDVVVVNQDHASATINATGSGAHYTLRVQTPILEGSVQIISQLSGKVLDVTGASMADGAAVIQFANHGGSNQQWRIVPLDSSGIVQIVSQLSGKVLDVAGDSLADGTPIIQYTNNGGANQQWKIVPLDSSGIVQIVSQLSGKVLDVAGDSLADGTPIIQYADNGGANQQWKIVPLG